MKITGIQHIGVPVRSMERSLAWYRDVFEIEPEFMMEADGPDTSAAVQLPDVSITAAFINVGNTYLELLEYHRPIGEDLSTRNCDVGSIHVCLDVDDIDEAYERLSSRGADFSAPPALIEEGPLAGYRFAYFRDPDRIQFELFQSP
jgi:catechol 2,3-dioxygenase-like lactoylglutathione lyase family enzyme